jgi:hypothetical protein
MRSFILKTVQKRNGDSNVAEIKIVNQEKGIWAKKWVRYSICPFFYAWVGMNLQISFPK